jgi:hypothetical protein
MMNIPGLPVDAFVLGFSPIGFCKYNKAIDKAINKARWRCFEQARAAHKA